MATVTLVLVGGPLTGRVHEYKGPAHAPGAYVTIIGPKNLEHVYRVAENGRIAFWVHS